MSQHAPPHPEIVQVRHSRDRLRFSQQCRRNKLSFTTGDIRNLDRIVNVLPAEYLSHNCQHSSNTLVYRNTRHTKAFHQLNHRICFLLCIHIVTFSMQNLKRDTYFLPKPLWCTETGAWNLQPCSQARLRRVDERRCTTFETCRCFLTMQVQAKPWAAVVEKLYRS
jgi:hypothetical protein